MDKIVKLVHLAGEVIVGFSIDMEFEIFHLLRRMRIK
jgi:hypothetical protein